MKFRMFLLSIAALMVAGAVFGSGICEEDTTMSPRTLVAPVAFTDSTNLYVGNYFPWTNQTFFSTFRNQYLYPSTQFASEGRTVQSISARSVTFMGSHRSTYETNGFSWNVLQILAKGTGGSYGTFGLNFATNRTGTSNYVDFVNPSLSVYQPLGPSYAPTLTITSNGAGDISWGLPDFQAIPWSGTSSDPNLVLDQGMDLAASGQGSGTIWDMGQAQGCWRAYGSASYYNHNNVTNAWGIDDAAFVWVYKGLSAPPPATLDAQIKEIVRLLLTPEALRCSDLDLDPNGSIKDEPVMFPAGKDVDPVSPQVKSGAALHMEEETNPFLRNRNFRP